MKSALWPFLLPSLRSHCELANLRDSTLFFVADSSLWAARLRHTSPQILHAARERCKIDATRLKVRVEPKPAAPDQKPRRRLSARAREVLRQAAETMNDEELARALAALAERD